MSQLHDGQWLQNRKCKRERTMVDAGRRKQDEVEIGVLDAINLNTCCCNVAKFIRNTLRFCWLFACVADGPINVSWSVGPFAAALGRFY